MASSPSEGLIPGFVPGARRPRGAGLLLFDLDDTLVQAGTYVSPRVIAALRAARDAGYVLSVCSGRTYHIMQRAVLDSGAMQYCICSNGASVMSLDDRREIMADTIDVADALDCHALLAPFKPAWNAFIGGRAYFEWKGASYMLAGKTGAISRAARQSDSQAGLAPVRALRLASRGARYVLRALANANSHQVRSILPYLREASGGVEKIGCTIPSPSSLDEALGLLRAVGRFQVAQMRGTELEITKRGVSKGTGARWLMDHLGIDARHAVAFGDSANDLPLARVCGTFVAVGNADQEVKDEATEVCGPVTQDGVALWLEDMLARGQQDGGRQ